MNPTSALRAVAAPLSLPFPLRPLLLPRLRPRHSNNTNGHVAQTQRQRQTRISPFTTTAQTLLKQMPPRPKPPPEGEIKESFLRGSGPGGQKINKTSSAVQLKHIPTGIVVKSQATRSREQNRKDARQLLAARIDELVNGDKSRTALVGGIKKKRSDSTAKKSRRKYRKLDEEKAQSTEPRTEPEIEPNTDPS